MTGFSKHYIVTNDCFIGKKGDEVVIDWNYYDGALWENLTSKMSGCPVSSHDVENIKEIINKRK